MQARKKVVIEELESESMCYEGEIRNPSVAHNKEISKRLTIEEITEDSRPSLDEICNCERNDDDVQPLSQKTRDMLNIFRDHHATENDSKNGLISTIETKAKKKSSQNNSETKNTSFILDRFSKNTEAKANFEEIEIKNNYTKELGNENCSFDCSQDEHSVKSILKNETETYLESNPECERKPANEKINKNMNESTNKILSKTKKNVNEFPINLNGALLQKVSAHSY
ncbi:hypothetical protein NPIL_552521 [Nephila pilipes]|uniref:Uncharacterized protein n=1 Tax=Nephila pilipes TaxID=299642 RepID=A0A8X6IWZ5_NEPPI|nr:hypothetical protein NPIL_552521 [Nephila pilipes]